MNSLPQWLKKRITVGEAFFDTKKVLSELSINTVCESSRCPNISECFSSSRVTFMILGKNCTRSCGFCSVKKGATPEDVDSLEPLRIAECVKRMKSKYAIVTSVTRDDLSDGGAGQFVSVVRAIKRANEGVTVELLVPDFAGNTRPIRSVALSGADIIGHNIETIERLYRFVRAKADYSRSLGVLSSIKKANSGVLTKSAILAGLGETKEEIIDVMRGLRKAGCDILTIGQYLRPSKDNHPVDRFVAPEEFEELEEIGMGLGFKSVSAAPFVRSSYNAEENHDRCKTATVS
jgi:lipoic acid synthetase